MTLWSTLAELIVTTLDSTLVGPLVVGRRYSIGKLLLFTILSGFLFLGAIQVRPSEGIIGFWPLAVFCLVFAVAAIIQLAGLTWEHEHKQKHEGYEIPTWLEALSWFVATDVMFSIWLRKHFPPQTAGIALALFGLALPLGLWLFNEICPGWLWWICGAIVLLAWLFALYCFWYSLRDRRSKGAENLR